MNICICGGGNLAHAITGNIGFQDENYKVNVLTRQPVRWNNKIQLYYEKIFILFNLYFTLLYSLCFNI